MSDMGDIAATVRQTLALEPGPTYFITATGAPTDAEVCEAWGTVLKTLAHDGVRAVVFLSKEPISLDYECVPQHLYEIADIRKRIALLPLDQPESMTTFATLAKELREAALRAVAKGGQAGGGDG